MTPWEDPNVKASLKSRQPSEISLVQCEECGLYGYYNDGSHFTCADPICGWSASGNTMDRIIDAGDVITLDDYTDMMADSEDYP